MKLIIVAAFVAACSAGRLEHLERSYLPPDINSLGYGSNGRSQNGFDSNGQEGLGFDSHGSSGSAFGSRSNSGSHGAFASNGGSDAGFGSSNGNDFGSSNGNVFDAATSNQYLPPYYGSSASSGISRSGSSSFRVPSTQYGTPSLGNNHGFGAQGGSQYQQGRSQQLGSGISNQYLTPTRSSGFQNIPQQSFDDQTGYHY